MSKLSPLSQNYLKNSCKITDFLVSRETFQLLYDENWDMLITDPIPENLEKYYQSDEYQPHKQQKIGVLNLIYNYIRKRNYRYKLSIINKNHKNTKSVLDYGTATGEFLEFLQKKTLKVSGVEPNDKARTYANIITNNKVAVSIDEIQNSFDVITLWHVLEHIPNLNEMITKFKQKLNKDGILVIAVPNYKSFDAQHYKKYWAAYDVPRHLWHFSPKSINKLFENHKMKVVSTHPLRFDSYYVSLLSEKYQTGRKCFINAFFNAFKSNRKAKKSGNYSSLIYVIRKAN